MAYIYRTRINSLEQMNRAIKRIVGDLKDQIKDESLLFDIRLIISELAINALDHGNKWDEDKFVNIYICLKNKRLYIEIKDQGDGIGSNIDSSKFSSSGRGLLIVKSLVDDLLIDDNMVKCFIDI